MIPFKPAPLPKSEAACRQLLLRGWASADEILGAVFGHWPPRGLEITHKNTARINLTDCLHHFAAQNPRRTKGKLDTQKSYGKAYVHGPRAIYVSKEPIKKHQATTVLAHEVVHILQGDTSGNARSRKLFGHTSTISQRREPAANTIARHCPTEYVDFNRISAHFNLARDGLERYNYLSEGLEVQARLMQIIVDMYPYCQRMPGNHEELYALLCGAGLSLPDDIQYMLTQTANPRALAAAFPVNTAPGKLPYFVSHTQAAINSLTDEGQHIFWHTVIPALYCDLIEMLGDEPGRARFGLGTNRISAARAELAKHKEILAAQNWVTDHIARSGERFLSIEATALPVAVVSDIYAALENLGIESTTHKLSTGKIFLSVAGNVNINRLDTVLKTTKPTIHPQEKIAADRPVTLAPGAREKPRSPR